MIQLEHLPIPAADAPSVQRYAIVAAFVADSIERYPAAQASLRLRGRVGWGGDAIVSIPPPETEVARSHARLLTEELRQKDCGCRPLRRNPAALCAALVDAGSEEALREALRLVRAGCDAALAERDLKRRVGQCAGAAVGSPSHGPRDNSNPPAGRSGSST